MVSNILQQGEKAVKIPLIMQLVEDNDIIDICIMLHNKKIHIGTSADSDSRNAPTYNKLYYIEKENYADIQGFCKNLMAMNNNDETFTLVSVDDIPASQMKWDNLDEMLPFNNKGKLSLKSICTKHLIKWGVIIFGVLSPLSIYGLCDPRYTDPIGVKLVPLFLAFVIFLVFCFYTFRFVLCVKKQEKKYNIKFIVSKYKLICDCLITEDWLIAVGRFALYKKEILNITKIKKNNRYGFNKIVIGTQSKMYRLTIDQESGINYLLKWIKK